MGKLVDERFVIRSGDIYYNGVNEEYVILMNPLSRGKISIVTVLPYTRQVAVHQSFTVSSLSVGPHRVRFRVRETTIWYCGG